ncbi:MAG: protein kinase [Legionellaceae bacterium]|nr:protein kinase [Legionellaceae bacterium]
MRNASEIFNKLEIILREQRVREAKILVGMAQTKAVQGDQSAIDDYEAAFKINPMINVAAESEDALFFYSMGKLYQSKNNQIQAIKMFSIAINLQPEILLAYRLRYRAYKITGNELAAKQDLMMINQLATFQGISDDDLIVGNEIIGSGNFGHVVDCTWKGHPAAIKKIQNKDHFEAEYEARLHGSASHPNIVSVFALKIEPNQNIYIIMERMSYDLFNLLTRKDQKSYLSLALRIHIIKGIISGLEFLHSKGFIHRDIKPDNIMLNEKMDVKIGDFGLAAKVGSKRAYDAAGSIGYTAPEVYRGKSQIRSDYYSFGFVLYSILTSFSLRIPNYKDNLIKDIQDNIDEIPPNLSNIFSVVILNYTLSKPELRIPSLRNFFYTLSDIEKNHSLEYPPKRKTEIKNPRLITDKNCAVEMQGRGLKLFSGPDVFWSSDPQGKKLRSNTVPYSYSPSPLIGL